MLRRHTFDFANGLIIADNPYLEIFINTSAYVGDSIIQCSFTHSTAETERATGGKRCHMEVSIG